MHVCEHSMGHVWRPEDRQLVGWFSSSTMWGLGIELELLGLATSFFIHCTISLAHRTDVWIIVLQLHDRAHNQDVDPSRGTWAWQQQGAANNDFEYQKRKSFLLLYLWHWHRSQQEEGQAYFSSYVRICVGINSDVCHESMNNLQIFFGIAVFGLLWVHTLYPTYKGWVGLVVSVVKINWPRVHKSSSLYVTISSCNSCSSEAFSYL